VAGGQGLRKEKKRKERRGKKKGGGEEEEEKNLNEVVQPAQVFHNSELRSNFPSLFSSSPPLPYPPDPTKWYGTQISAPGPMASLGRFASTSWGLMTAWHHAASERFRIWLKQCEMVVICVPLRFSEIDFRPPSDIDKHIKSSNLEENCGCLANTDE
jgi:hypothetical protein